MACAMLVPTTMTAQQREPDQEGHPREDGVWRKTIIVKTLDGTTMEYLIDKDTKVKIEKPNLIIETEGVVLTCELESMGQIRYGKRYIETGVGSLISDYATPFKMKDELLYFNDLKEDTQITIYSSDGKTIISRRYSGNAQISLNVLPAGIYLVKMNDETYKLLKK
jgi:hypothetical protein